jgi:excisionase family DNA binding protein
MVENNETADVVTLFGYPDLLDTKQVQQVLGLGRSIVYMLIRNGEIRHMKIHGKIRIPRRYLVEYINTLWYSENNTTDAGKLSVMKEV